ASVPPEVNTISLGSRAPISFASCSRPRSIPPSASQPKGWLRLPGCPNFSVKYGSIASRTRGSIGVVDWLSMKMGRFTAIACVSSLGRAGQRERQLDRAPIAVHPFERQRVEELLDARLDHPHRLPDVAPAELRALEVLVAVHDAQRPLDGPEHLAHRDLP